MFLLCALGVALRAIYLTQPMRYDESVTYLYFVRLPWASAIETYTYPNNHVFHTVLAKACVTIFGNAPWALRLPAFLAGVLIVPATYAVTRVLYGSRAALFATAIVASSGVLTMYSTNARGYTLMILAFLCVLLIGARLSTGDKPGLWVAFAVIGAIGLWTVPVMLFPFGAVAAWLALTFLLEDRADDLKRLLTSLGVTAGLTALAYAPILMREGLSALTRNRFVASSGWYEFLGDLPSTIGEALTSWSLGVPPLVSVILAGFAVLALARHRGISRFPVSFAVAAFVWSAWLLVVNHRAPFARVWLWLFPFAAALASAGAVSWLEGRKRMAAILERRAPAIAVVFAIAAALSVSLSRAVLLTRDTGTYQDAERAADALSRTLRPTDRILAAIPTNAPLAYYLDKRGAPTDVLARDERTATRILVVVDALENQTLETVTARSAVHDSTQFGNPTLLATLPNSMIVAFERRGAAPR